MRASILLPPDKQRSLPASQLRHREEQLFTALAIYPHLEVQLCCLSLKKKKKNYYILTSHKSTEIQELKIQPFTPTHCNVTLYKSSTVLVVFVFF